MSFSLPLIDRGGICWVFYQQILHPEDLFILFSKAFCAQLYDGYRVLVSLQLKYTSLLVENVLQTVLHGM